MTGGMNMFKTRMTELLKIKYPIMQGGLHNLGRPELAAAVSNAGCLGTINFSNYDTVDEFHQAIKQTKALTDKPFCVNVSTATQSLSPGEKMYDCFQVIMDEKVAAVEISGLMPEAFVPSLKKAGVKILHKVPAARFAEKAQRVGADAAIIVGVESAGRPSLEAVTTMVVANKAASLVTIPVLAAGGIADGKGLVAALALGAEGVVMGTRFIATTECAIHPNFKEMYVKASEKDTVLVQRSIQNQMRVMANDVTRKSDEMEKRDASREELLSLLTLEGTRRCQANGDINGIMFATGQAVGLVHEIKPVKEVIEDIIQEAQSVMARLNTVV